MGVKQLLYTSNVEQSQSSGTFFFPFQWNQYNSWGTQQYGFGQGVQTRPWSVAGTFKNLYVQLQNALGAATTMVVTLRINGTDTALTCTISALGTTANDTTHSVSISAGDRITWKAVVGSQTVIPNLLIALEFDGTNAGESGYCCGLRPPNIDAAVIGWHNLPGGIGYGPLGLGALGGESPRHLFDPSPPVAGFPSNLQMKYGYQETIIVPGNITRLDILSMRSNVISAVEAGASFTFAFIKNDIIQDGSGGTVDTRVTITGATTASSWTGTLSVVKGDNLRIYVAQTGVTSTTGNLQLFGTSWRLTATTDGEFQLGLPVYPGFTPPAGTTVMYSAAGSAGGGLGGWTTSESTFVKGPTMPFSFWINDSLVMEDPNVPSVSITTPVPTNYGYYYNVSMRINGATPTPDLITDPLPIRQSGWHFFQKIWFKASSSSGTVAITAGDTFSLIANAILGPVGPEPTFANAKVNLGLTWIIITLISGAQIVWSDVPLSDDPDYYLGWKEPKIINWGAIRRALSDFLTGRYETTELRILASDINHIIAQYIEDKELVNASVVVYMIEDPNRRLKLTAREVYRGVIRDVKRVAIQKFEIVIKDTFAERFSNTNSLIPDRLYTPDEFANCNVDLVMSSAESYVADGASAIAATVIPIHNGHGVFAKGDKVKFGAGTNIYSVTESSMSFDLTESGTAYAANIETSITITPALISGISNGDAVVQIASHKVEPAAGKRVPFYYGFITDLKIIGGIDAGDGQGVVDYLGDETFPDGKRYGVFGWSSHSCYSPGGIPIPALYFWNESIDLATYAAVGERVCLPGYGNWATTNGFATSYTNRNSKTYTIFGLRGIFRDWALGITEAPQNLGGIPLAVNAYGCENTGFGTGSLITNGIPQYLHIIQNWCPPKGDAYTSGGYATSPTFPDDVTLKMIDEESFQIADDQSKVYVNPDGFRGDFGVGVNNEGITAIELIARLNISFGVQSGFNRKTQYFISMINTDIGSVDLKDPLTWILDIFSGSFEIEPLTRLLSTILDYRHTQDYFKRASGGWRSVITGITQIENTAATTDYGGTPTVSPQINFYMLRGKNRAEDADDYDRGSDTIDAVLALMLARLSNIQHLPKLHTGPAGFNYDLGDTYEATHYEGLGTAGYVDRPIRIERHETRPSDFTARLEGYDLDPMI